MKSKKTKRSRTKYPALTLRVNSRVRQDRIDFDYLDKLSEEELTWLNKFMEEENGASFKNDGTDFNKTKEERKKIYDANNRNNRDQYGLTKAKVANTKLLNYDTNLNMIEEELGRDNNPRSMETAYVDFIEHKQIEDFLKEYDSAMLLFNEAHE